MTAARWLLGGVALLAGCNHYELFRVTGDKQAEFSNDADILFVVDNSTSTMDKSAALALNFDVFIRRLTDPSEGGHGTDGLPDAVDAYIDYVQNRAYVVDYQIGITTTDVQGTYGALYGDPPILENSYDGDVATAFDRSLLCEATCVADRGDFASDPAYSCGDPPPPPGDAISQQYMDCLCGNDSWVGQCGAGTEEPLEAIFMAMCRAAEDPPASCFEELDQFTEADIGSNAGMLRPNSTLIPIIITDEGDTSTRRMSQGDGEPDEYADLYEDFKQRMAFAVIAPDTELCNPVGTPDWAVDRLRWFVDHTNGRFFPISVPDGAGCKVADFADAMEQLGDLLNGLRTRFPLEGVPDEDTIRCFVDGREVDRASETEQDGAIVYGDGWSYDPIANEIAFHGDAVPDYGMSVEIYYRPVQGMPRELPF